jgi:hypothetical protein
MTTPSVALYGAILGPEFDWLLLNNSSPSAAKKHRCFLEFSDSTAPPVTAGGSCNYRLPRHCHFGNVGAASKDAKAYLDEST